MLLPAVLVLASLGAVRLDVHGGESCQLEHHLRLALEARGVQIAAASTQNVEVTRDPQGIALKWRGELRPLGKVACDEAASLIAAIVSEPAPPPAPPAKTTTTKRKNVVTVTKRSVATTRPPATTEAPPPTRETSAPIAHETGPAIATPLPSPPPPSAPALVGPPPSPEQPKPPPVASAASPDAGTPLVLRVAAAEATVASDASAPAPAAEVTTRGPVERTPLVLSWRLSGGLGVWATQEPRASPSADLELGLMLGRWLIALRADAPWPESQAATHAGVDRGTLTAVSLAFALAAGRCFGGSLYVCGGLSGGVRTLYAQAQGNLYQLNSAWSAVPMLGLWLAGGWQLSGTLRLEARLNPWIPLAKTSAQVEGTTAKVTTGFEGTFGIGLVWNP